jgi:hypothetical protein
MEFVRVSFTGRCRDRQAQMRLVTYLRRLAERSQRYLSGQDGVSLETIDRSLDGRIPVSATVAPDARVFADQAKDAGLEFLNEAGAGGAAVLPDARLFGLDFRLFDTATVRGGHGHFSLIFLQSTATPFLDGALVQIGGDQRLERPKLELPSDLGEWADLLFSWIKFFHVGDFSWHRGEPLPNYSDYRAILLELQHELGPERAEAAAFNALVATFANHAEDFASTTPELA